MRTKCLRKLLVCLAVIFAFLFVDAVVIPVVNPSAVEVQAAQKIKINQKKKTLYVKQTTTLKVTGTTKKATWSSSNKKVAKVSKTGKVTALKKGTATITAKIGKKKYTCKITVKNPTISSKKATIYTGGTKTLKVKNAVGTVKWSTSNKAVATVSKKGVVTGKKAGTATITAKASGIKLTCKVTVKNKNIDVTGVTLDKTSASLTEGDTLALTATVVPANATDKTVTWSSDNASVAAVDSKGAVTAKKAGTARITAKAGRVTSICTVTVKAKSVSVTGVTLDKSKAELTAGGTLTLKATVKPDNASNKEVTWSSGNKEVAVVDKGVVTAVKDGTATITVTTKDGNKKAECTVTVKTPLTDLLIPESRIQLSDGEEKTIEVSPVPANSSQVTYTYTSSDKKVATVSDTGVVKGVATGTAVVTVNAKDAYDNRISKQINVAVVTHAKSIVLNESSITQYVNGTFTINATVLPEETANKQVKYSSEDPSIADVSDSGIVTAKSPGTTRITVTSADDPNVSQVLEVTVNKPTDLTVSNQEGLDSALQDPEITKIRIETENNENFTIPEGDHSDVSLVLNAPGSHVENYAKFKDVTIEAISENSYVEHAVGNRINYSAASGTVKIAEEGQASLTTLPGAGKMNLVNDGSISQITVASAGNNISISGASVQMSISLKITTEAQNTFISTSLMLNINAENQFSLEVNGGAENTRVTVDDAASIPSVSGLGRIEVKISVNGKIENVIADSSDHTGSESVAIKGLLRNAPSGTDVYIIPYSAGITKDNISKENAIVTAKTDDDGYFVTSAVPIGNYYLYVNQNGYIPILETLIITSAESSEYSAQTLEMIKSADADVTGGIKGTIVDAETGNTVPEGLTVLIRQGGNNISGDYLNYTMTDEYGSYSFSDLAPGVYTVQIIDQRDDVEEYYVNTYFNASVAGSGVYVFDNSVTRIINSAQIRFKLQWGDEESGASSDLDSHLIGPAQGGYGQFHTWYSDQSYYADGVKIADLDLDDTDWVGPETTTIYVRENGVYSFYVHDYTNSDSSQSSQMSRSSAEVKVYIGDQEMATYYCPNKEGNLWYVCDYDSATNQFIPKNTVMSYDDDLQYIGTDMVERYRSKLNDAIGEFEKIRNKYPDFNAPEISLEHAYSVLRDSEDLEEIKEEYEKINDVVVQFNDSLRIGDIECLDENGNNVIYDWWTDEYEDIDTVDIMSYIEILPDNISVYAKAEDSTAEIVESDMEGYAQAVKVTNSLGYSKKYYISFSTYLDLSISYVSAVDEEDNELIYDYYSKWVGDEEDEYRELYIEGYPQTLPDFVKITCRTPEPYAKVEIKESDRSGYTDMVVISGNGQTEKYYINYRQYVDFRIGSVEAVDEYGNNVVTTWNTDWEYDEEDDEYRILNIRGRAGTMPESLRVIPWYEEYGVKAEIQASDRSGFEKMAVLTGGESSRVYYIRYYAVVPLYIGGASAYDDEDNNLIIDCWTEDFESDGRENNELYIQGVTPELPEGLTVTGYSYDEEGNYIEADTEVKDSDLEGYDKMVTVSGGGMTLNYYIIYQQSVSLDIKSVEAINDEDDVITTWNTDWEYDEEDDEYYYILNIRGTVGSMPASLSVIPMYEEYGVKAEIQASDRSGFEKMVVLTNGERFREFYIRYYAVVPLYISGVSAYDDEDNNLISDSWTSRYESGGREIHELYIRGVIPEMPEGLTIDGYGDDEEGNGIEADTEVKDSDLEGYDKMVTVSGGGMTLNYYIIYQQYVALYIDSVEAVDEYGNNVSTSWGLAWEYDDDTDEEYEVLYIEGESETLPESLRVIPTYEKYGVNAEIQTSDRSGYEKMVVLTNGEESRTCYISWSDDSE